MSTLTELNASLKEARALVTKLESQIRSVSREPYPVGTVLVGTSPGYNQTVVATRLRSLHKDAVRRRIGADQETNFPVWHTHYGDGSGRTHTSYTELADHHPNYTFKAVHQP
jgi:hypothetical protein